MFRYEILMLAIPEITKDEVSAIETNVEKVVTAAKGSIVSFERWGKYKLAYPIAKNEYGVYYLVRYETPTTQAVNEQLRELLAVKFDTTIMRFITTALESDAPLAYQRPLSLEEAPAKSAGSFLREKGLMGEDGYSDRGFERRSDRFGRSSREERESEQEQDFAA